MYRLHFSRTEDYGIILRMEQFGKSAEERGDKALSIHLDKLSAIKERQGRQLVWVLAGYVVPGLAFTLAKALGDETAYTSSILISMLFMNVAAFQYGKYQFFSAAEGRDYEASLAKWEREGKTHYGS